MLEVYWGCLIGGIIFAIVTVIFGDFISDLFDGLFDFLSFEGPDFFHPMIVVGGITIFGGAGVLLTEYTFFAPLTIAILALVITILFSLPMYFFYVKPMQESENSTGFSMKDLEGQLGEVSIPIPSKGYGEVLISVGGAGLTHQIAASFDHIEIASGQRVVIVKSEEGVLYVSPFNNGSGLD